MACASRCPSRRAVPPPRKAAPRRSAWPRPNHRRATAVGLDQCEQRVAPVPPKPNPPRPPRIASRSTSNQSRKNLGPRRFALDPKRREGRVLTDRDHALPRHFKRRGKRRSPDRAAHFGRRTKSYEISVEHRPIERPPGKFFKFARACASDQTNRCFTVTRERLFRASGIGGQQPKACAPLRRAAGEAGSGSLRKTYHGRDAAG